MYTVWIMNHFKEAKCDIPVVCRSSVFSFYKVFYKQIISDHFPCAIEDTPFLSIKDFKLFTRFLLVKETIGIVSALFSSSSPQHVFPEEPFDYPLLLQLTINHVDKQVKFSHSEYASLSSAS